MWSDVGPRGAACNTVRLQERRSDRLWYKTFVKVKSWAPFTLSWNGYWGLWSLQYQSTLPLPTMILISTTWMLFLARHVGYRQKWDIWMPWVNNIHLFIVIPAHNNLWMLPDEHTELRPCTIVKDTLSFKKYFLDLKPSKDQKEIFGARKVESSFWF